MAVITLSLLAILGLLLKDQFFYEYDLKGYIDISRLDLDSSNYNKMSNLEAGTIIVTDMDGNKGIVEDTFFNIMMVCLKLNKMLCECCQLRPLTPCLSPLDFWNIKCHSFFFQFRNIKFKMLENQFDFEIDFCRLHKQ